MSVPEKLNLWDRIFNRYRKTVHSRGNEEWHRYRDKYDHDPVKYSRAYVEYLVVDRLTGSEEIQKVYLD